MIKTKDMTDYEKSNGIVEVHYTRLSSKEYNKLLTDKNRKEDAQNLLNYLCAKYNIKKIPLIVADTQRKCKGNREIYGSYKYCNGVGIHIKIYNRTAKTAKEVSIKAFVNTLLHEFIHHYDTEFLKIQSSHTTGFYKRISDLQKKLEK